MLGICAGTRRVLVATLIGLGAGVASVLGSGTPLVERYEGQTLDLRTRIFAVPSRADRRIVGIVIDQKSIDAVAAPRERGGLDVGWPWPRDYYAAVLDYLAGSGVRAVGIDVAFTEPSIYSKLGAADDDADLATAYIDRPVVQAMMLTHEATEGAGAIADRAWPEVLRDARRSRPLDGARPRFNKATLPHEVLLRAVDNLGWIGFEPDPDGIGRAVLPAASYAPAGQTDVVEILAFPLVLARVAGARLEMRSGRPAAEHLVVDGRRIPIDEDGRMLLRFHGGENAYRQFSFAKVLESAKRHASGEPVTVATPDDFRGKIVLIGASAAGLLDLRSTPVSATLPGYLVHATALDNLLHGDPLRRVPVPVRVATTLALGILCSTLMALLVGFRRSAAAALGLAAAYVCVALSAFALRNLWLDLVPPIVALALAYGGTTAYLYVSEGRERRFLRDAFSRYLSPPVVESLVADPGRLVLGGESREITVMFADVAGFTNFSEGRQPSELVTLMNEYFTALTDIVQRHGGTVDKFIGDAVMAFWNAPLEQADHAARACQAAREGLDAVDELARAWTARGLPLIRMRVGLATGPALVGNVGARTKFNYTAMGDTVNLASRLEGAAKVYGTSSLIAGTTVERARGAVPTRELDWLQVKGKHEPVPVFELLRDTTGKESEVVGLFAEGLAAYRARRFAEAARSFEIALTASPQDGPSREMLDRCREYAEHPPPPEWRGEHALTTK